MTALSGQAQLLQEILESVSNKRDIVKPLPNDSAVQLVTQIIPDEIISRVSAKSTAEVVKPAKKVKPAKVEKQEPVSLAKPSVSEHSLGRVLLAFCKSLLQGFGFGLGLALVCILAWLIVTDLSNAPRVLSFIHSLLK